MSIISAAARVSRPDLLATHLGKGLAAALGDGLADGLVRFYTRGLAALDLPGAMAELAAGAITTRTRKPLWHIHVNPLFRDPVARSAFFRVLHVEFPALMSARFLAAIHRVGDRGDHEHRVYDITGDDGKVADLRFDKVRRSKVAVLTCHELGWPVPPIAHVGAVEAALRREGRHAVADWLMSDPRSQQGRRVATTPAERQQAERTGVDPFAVQDAAWNAWFRARDGPSLLQGLIRAGLIPCIGRRNAVALVDRQGGIHGLSRLLKAAAKRHRQQLDTAALATAVAALTHLPTVEDVQRDRQQPHADPGPLPEPHHPDPAQPHPRGNAPDARAPGAPGRGGGDEPHRLGTGGHGDGRPGEHPERVAPGLAGPGPSRAARVAARARARLLMARRPVRNPAEEEARRAAAEAIRIAKEEAARVEAVAIRRDAARTIAESQSDIEQTEDEMEDLRRRHPPSEVPEHVAVAREDARRTAVELASSNEVLAAARKALAGLPAAPRPGLLSRILARLPWRRRRAEERAAAERAVQAAQAIRDQKQEDHNEAVHLQATVDRDWERAIEAMTRLALKQRAERLAELRGLVFLLKWRADYIRRTPAEIADAIRDRIWQNDDGDGEGGAAPAAPPCPARRQMVIATSE